MSKSPSMGNEKEYGQNIDKCLTDLGIKMGAGMVVGGLFSLLFRRRTWPITLGAGIGIGMAYKSCEYRFAGQYCEKPGLNKTIEAPKDATEVIQPDTLPALENSSDTLLSASDSNNDVKG